MQANNKLESKVEEIFIDECIKNDGSIQIEPSKQYNFDIICYVSLDNFSKLIKKIEDLKPNNNEFIVKSSYKEDKKIEIDKTLIITPKENELKVYISVNKSLIPYSFENIKNNEIETLENPFKNSVDFLYSKKTKTKTIKELHEEFLNKFKKAIEKLVKE